MTAKPPKEFGKVTLGPMAVIGGIGKLLDDVCAVTNAIAKSIEKRSCYGCERPLKAYITDGSDTAFSPARWHDPSDALTHCDDCRLAQLKTRALTVSRVAPQT